MVPQKCSACKCNITEVVNINAVQLLKYRTLRIHGVVLVVITLLSTIMRI